MRSEDLASFSLECYTSYCLNLASVAVAVAAIATVAKFAVESLACFGASLEVGPYTMMMMLMAHHALEIWHYRNLWHGKFAMEESTVGRMIGPRLQGS